MISLLNGAYSALSRIEDWIRIHGSDLWEFTNPAAVAFIAWVLASWYQGRSKRWELRSAIYLETNKIYYRLYLAAGRHQFFDTKDSAPVQQKKVAVSELKIVLPSVPAIV